MKIQTAHGHVDSCIKLVLQSNENPAHGKVDFSAKLALQSNEESAGS